MNPLTNVRNIKYLNEREIKLGISEKSSWHQEYKDSAWIFIGGLPYSLTEGDVLCVFSQYGEIVNVNLIRDKKTGKSKGYAFLCYEDQRSTILAVDNFNGIKLTGRTIRVDHVANYRIPKDHPDIDEVTRTLRTEGCAPKVQIKSDTGESDEDNIIKKKENHRKKQKKVKKKKKKIEKKRKHESSSSSSSRESSPENVKRHHLPVVIKKEKEAGFSKYEKMHRVSERNQSKERDYYDSKRHRKHSRK